MPRRRYRVTVAISVLGRNAGSHTLSVSAPSPPAAGEGAIAALRDSYDEDHVLAVTDCREAGRSKRRRG